MAYPVMISCKQRVSEREKTVEQFVGLTSREPHVLEMSCEPPSIEANRWGAFWAAMSADEANTGLLFLEDDLDFAPSFPRFLRMAEAHDRLTVFCVMRNNLYPEGYENRVRRATKTRGGHGVLAKLVELPLERVQRRRGFHGSQALYLPPKVVQAVLDARDEFVQKDGGQCPPGSIEHGFDFWIKDNAHRWGIYAAYPNPVQHRNAPSMFGGKGTFVSDSFDLPVSFEG